MRAAGFGRPATVLLLLDRGCDVDRRDEDGETALDGAIKLSVGDDEKVFLIGSRTTVGLGHSLELLAKSKVRMTERLEKMVRGWVEKGGVKKRMLRKFRKLMKKKDARIEKEDVLEALKTSTEYGNSGLVKTLLFAVNPEEILLELVNTAVMADSPETVQILVDRHKDELRKIDASVIDNVIAKAVER